jgi:hypothetical protein
MDLQQIWESIDSAELNKIGIHPKAYPYFDNRSKTNPKLQQERDKR